MYMWESWVIGHDILAANTGTTLLVPYLEVKSLRSIWRWGSHLRDPIFKLVAKTELQDKTSDYVAPAMASGPHVPLFTAVECNKSWTCQLIFVFNFNVKQSMTILMKVHSASSFLCVKPPVMCLRRTKKRVYKAFDHISVVIPPTGKNSRVVVWIDM